MIENGFISYEELNEPNHPLNTKPITALNLPQINSLISEESTIGEALEYFKK